MSNPDVLADSPTTSQGITAPIIPSPTESGPAPDELFGLKDMPKEVGVLLFSAGVLGCVLPGPGTPALIAGGLILWPERFGKVEGWVRRRFPTFHRGGMGQMKRYLTDLERRYPGALGGDEPEPVQAEASFDERVEPR